MYLNLEKIKIGVLNLRGTNEKKKTRIMFERLAKIRCTFLILQETKLRKGLITDVWKILCDRYDVYENRTMTSALGMAILVVKEVSPYVIKVTNVSSRIMFIKLSYEGRDVVVYNIHMPIVEKERKAFIFDIMRSMNLITGFKILCGDFNVNTKSKEKAISVFIKDSNMMDLAVELKLEYVKTRMDRHSANRLDRILIDRNLKWKYSLKFHGMTYTDHIMIVLNMYCEQTRINTLRRVGLIPNIEILDMKKILMEVEEGLRKVWNKITPVVLWFMIKHEAYERMVKDQLVKQRGIKYELELLYAQLDGLIREENKELENYNKIQLRIQYLETVDKKYLLNKMRKNHAVTVYTPKWLMAKILKRKKASGQIIAVKQNNTIFVDNYHIITQTQKEYVEEYDVGLGGRAREGDFDKFYKLKVNRFFRSRSVLVSPVYDIEDWNADFTVGELERAIAKGKVGAMPGPDGLNVEFYKVLNNEYKKCLLNMFNQMLNDDGNIVWQEINKVFLKMIPKRNKMSVVIKQKEDWRPIALINDDIKVLQRMILERVIEVMEKMMIEGVFGIRNRPIQMALMMYHTVFNMLDKKQRKTAYLVRLDMKNAFNNTNVKYLRYLIEKYLGKSKLLELMIKTIERKFIAFVNDKHYAFYQEMKNSILQGSPLSPLLYTFYLVELHVRIKEEIKGVYVCGKTTTIGLIAYLDDVTVVVRGKEQLDKLHVILNEFTTVTGSTINYQKSYVYDIVSNKIMAYKNYQGNHEKILGIPFPLRGQHTMRQFLIDRIKEEEKKLNTSLFNYLGWVERVDVLNRLVLPRFWYYLPFTILTGNIVKVFNRFTQNVIFGKFKIMSCRKTKYPLNKGGLGLIDVHRVKRIMDYRMVDRVINKEGALESIWRRDFSGLDRLYGEWLNNYRVLQGIADNSGIERLNTKKLLMHELEQDPLHTQYRNRKADLRIVKKLKCTGRYADFIIKIMLKILPTKVRLNHIGILRTEQIQCVFCNVYQETSDHLFQCSGVGEIANMFINRIKAKYNRCIVLTISDLGDIPLRCKKLCFTIFFAIWKARCKVLFTGTGIQSVDKYILDEVHKMYTRDLFTLQDMDVQRIWDKGIME